VNSIIAEQLDPVRAKIGFSSAVALNFEFT
jgi:hypothetical protein